MNFSPELKTLAHYLAGEFDNRQQALADPAWYVHLRLWQRPVPVPLVPEPGITLFAEQANIVNLDRPYRPRILHLQQPDGPGSPIQVQYYMLVDFKAVCGAGRNPTLLETLAPDRVKFLPGCTLTVTWQTLASGGDDAPHRPEGDRFFAALQPDARCCFDYEGQVRQVSLGFETGQISSPTESAIEFLSYDKGIDPITGKALWGAILGPYRFLKQQDFSVPILG